MEFLHKWAGFHAVSAEDAEELKRRTNKITQSGSNWSPMPFQCQKAPWIRRDHDDRIMVQGCTL